MGLRKLDARPESAPLRCRCSVASRLNAMSSTAGVSSSSSPWDGRALPQVLHDLLGGCHNFIAALLVGVGRSPPGTRRKLGEAAPVLRRVVRAAIEGLQGPASGRRSWANRRRR